MTHPSSVLQHAPARLLILSDLHLGFSPFAPPDASTFDIVVLAGDISTGVRSVQWAQDPRNFGGKPVVLVPGNHEFYGAERCRTLELMREHASRSEGSNVHLLDRDEVILQGVRFLGATLWTNFALDVQAGTSVESAMAAATWGLNDFAGAIGERQHPPPGWSEDPSKIRRRSRRFTPADALREHRLSRAWLQDRLDVAAPDDVFATVIASHHGPCIRSMDPVYEGSALNPCFYSELPASLFRAADGRPRLWVHGHTHSSCDYRHHDTRVVVNPRGYVRGGVVENERFDPALVITLVPEGHHG